MISQAIRTTFSIHSAVFVRSGLTVSRLWGSVKVRFGFDLNLRWKNFEFDPTILRANSTQPPFSHPLSSCLQFFHLPLPFFHSSIFHSPSSLPPSSIPPLPFPLFLTPSSAAGLPPVPGVPFQARPAGFGATDYSQLFSLRAAVSFCTDP